MPRVVFSAEVEQRLIELWGKYQREKSGTMMKRAVAEKRIADELNLYAKQLSGGDQEMIYTAAIVHNKIDNLKTKARDQYKKYRKKTATGSPAGDASEDSSYDLGTAFATWTNFKSWHRIFKTVPGYGPMNSISSVSVCGSSQSSQSSLSPCTTATEYTPRRISSTTATHSPDDAFDILSAQGATDAVSAAGVATSTISPARSAVRYQSPQASSQACAAPADMTGATTPTSRHRASGPHSAVLQSSSGSTGQMIERETSGRDSDEDRAALDGAMYGSPQTDETYEPSLETNVRCAPALGGRNSDDGTQEVVLAEMSDDDNDNAFIDVNEDTHDVDEPAPKKKRKPKKKRHPEAAGASTLDRVVDKINKGQKKSQKRQQSFLSTIIQQQQTHTQNLMQSHMEFTARLFDKHF